jgi:predicted restriction endonuclease
MPGYIINTDPHWISYLMDSGIRNPVFWRKGKNNPNNSALAEGNPIFFRITNTNPPVIKGIGYIKEVGSIPLSQAFLLYGDRLGYTTIAEMIKTSSWTSGVELNENTEIFYLEISDFQVVQDIRTDTELRTLDIAFDHQHVVTGKAIDDVRTAKLPKLAAERTIYQTNQLEKFFRENVNPYLHAEFNPSDIQDARDKVARLVSKRRGQPEFQRKLLDAYNSKCAMSQCDAIPALEAAHIIPYKGPETNHISNGLLLRADLHTLFDLCHIAVDTTNMAL